MPIFENITVESKQKWQGKEIKFDEDASPAAWEHYKQWYSETFNNYNVCSPSLFLFDRDKEVYFPTIADKNNRLYALPTKTKPLTDEDGNEYFQAVERLSGDTDFNFNEKHYPCFELHLNDEPNENLRREYLSKLDKCKKMHHSLLNFSLMQTMGNMQGFKGKICDDRLDRFIYYLGKFYNETDKCKRRTTDIISYSSETNRDILMDYLNQFASLSDYFKKIYFIDDAEFIEKLRLHGQENKKLDNSEKVRTYIDLAHCFWEKKDFYFSKKEYLTIGSYFSDGGETYTHEELTYKLTNDLGIINQKEINIIIEKCINRGFMIRCTNDAYTR